MRTVEHHASLDSTNAELRRRVETGHALAGLLVLADAQTAGRGQRGATWHTAPGRSLAASLLLARPELARPARVTLLAALAAAEALEAAGSGPIAIKWPNDLQAGERKVGGLLVEGVSAPSGAAFLVVGLGVNLALAAGDLPDSLSQRAGSLALPADLDARRRLVAHWADALERALAELGTAADRARGESYRRRSWLRGRQVRLLFQGSEVQARIADVSGEGDLLLDDGRCLRGEHVRLLPETAG